MILIFDIGNTNTKIAFYNEVEYKFIRSVSNDIVTDELVTLVNKFEDSVCRVVICSVGPKSVLSTINDYFLDIHQIKTEVLTTKKEMFGVLNGYKDYTTLGVDRWLSILAASEYSNNTIVISAGTALTVDVVFNKKHQGGVIVPGLTLMRKSLAQGTDLINIGDFSFSFSDEFFPSNTSDAVFGGTLYMVTSFLNSFISDIKNEKKLDFKIIASGGDFLKIEPLMDDQVEVVSDLVIKGILKVINCK